MGYDYSSAIEAGLTDSQIAEFLSQEYGNYNIEDARQAGLSDGQIAQFLSQYEPEQEEDKNIFDHVGDFLGGVGTGIASTPLLAAEGAAGLAYAIAPDLFPSIEESDVVEFSRKARQDVQSYLGGDAQSDAYGVGNALGSFATFLIPGIGQIGLAAKGLATTGKVVGWGGGGALAVGAGAGEQVESILAANKRLGEEIPDLDKRLSILMGGAVGLTELASLRLPLGLIASKLPKNLVTKPMADSILKKVGNVFLAGGAEGAQEAIAGVLQDLISKNMYDPSLEIGESWASDLGYGGSAGAIFQGILQATIGRRGQKAPGQIDTVVGDPKDTVVAEDAPETILEESRRLSQLALPAPPPIPLQIEDHSIDSDRVMEPDADIASIAQRTVDQLAGDLPVAFTNGQIALDTDGVPVSYEVSSGDKGPHVKTRAGIKVSPYFATIEQAEAFKDEMNAGVFDIMQRHDQVEQDTLAREALKEAKIEETEATLDAARKTYLPAAIEFDTLPPDVAGQINIHNSRVGKNTKVRGDVVSISEMADANISQDIIDGLLPEAMNTGTIEGVRETASQKNIIIDSEASSQTGTHDDGFVRFVYGLTGGKDLNRMSGAQLATVQMKLDELPSFSQPTSLPTIRQPDFTPSQYATVIAMARDMPRRTVGKKGGRVLEKGEFQKSDINNVLDKTGDPTEQIIERALSRGDIRAARNARGKEKRGVYRYNRPAPVQTPLQRGELIEAEERARAQEEADRTAEEGTISPVRERLLRGGTVETTGETATAPKSGILIRRSDTDSKLTSEQAAQEMKNRASRAQAIPQFKQRMENLGGREAINKALGSALRLFQNKIPALKNVPLTVRYVNTLTEEGAEGTKEGMIRQTDDKQVIVLALDALENNQDGSPPSREQALKQLSSVMSHEIIHVLRNAGIITKADWKVLTNFVETNNAVTREGGKLDKTWFDEISEVYKDQPLTREELVEEAVAEAFRAYADGVMKVVGKPRNLFNRIADFFIAMRRGFKKIDVLSAADVFGKYAPVPASTEFVPAGITPTQEQVVTAQETRERLGQSEADAPITQFSIKRERVSPRDTAFTAFNEGNNNLTLNGKPIPPKGKVRRLSAIDILYNDGLAARSEMSIPFAAELLDMKGRRFHKKQILIEEDQSQDNLISDVLALEAKAALRYGDNASGWYSEKIQEALEKASQVYPEIKTNPDAKFALLVSLAITSQNTNVVLNTRYADQVYSYFRENGKFPIHYGKGKSSQDMRDNFSLLNSLIERFDNQGGISKVHQFFNEEFTVKQLTEEGFNFSVPKQEGMRETVFGSYLLGAKIGQGFYQNLNGNFNPVTIDMWLMRTFGRLTGRLVGNPGAFPKQQERLFKALIERGDPELIGRMREAVEAKDTDAIIELAGEVRLEFERIFKTPEVQKAYKKNPKKWSKEEKPEWAKAAQTLYDGQIKPKDSPFGSGYRKSVRRIMTKTKEKLSRDGIEVTNADLQAILWYPEKNLYSKLGAKVKDLNTDYSQAYDILLERKKSDGTETNQRALERGTARQGIDADTRGTGRDRGEVDERETPTQYSIARRVESTDVQKGHLSRTQSWFSRLAEDLGYSRMPADAFEIEHLVTPQLKNDASLIWNGRAWPVIIHRGVNKKVEGRDKGFGLVHANRHRAEIVENTPANSVSDFVEIVMGAYWPHRDGQARDQQVDDQAKNFQLLRQENGLIKLRWNNPEWKYPSTLIFREVPFDMFPNVVSARPELKGRGYMALVTAFPNNANKKDVTRPMDSPIINPNASVAATQAANESIAGENPNPKRETLKLRKQYSLKRRYAQLPPEEKALHKKIIGGSPPDQTLGEKVLGIEGLDKYNPNNPWGWRTKFRHEIVDKWASVFKTEKLVQKKRKQEGLDHDIATDSAASAAFSLLDRASGVISAILTVGPPIYDRGRIYAINSNSLKVSAAAGKHRDKVRANYQRAMDRLIEESAYIDPVTGKQIRWESADEVDGLLNILKPLESKGLLESFLLYSIGKRAQRLNAEGREKTLTDADIEAALAIGEKDPAIKQAHRKYQLWNNSVVNMMVDAGVISQDMATLWKQNADYLPFYRELYDDAGVAYRLVSGEGTPTKDMLYKTLDDNKNNKMFQSFWKTKQPRELKGGKPVYWVMVNDVADSGRYTSPDSKQLQDRLQALKELNKNDPNANVRIAVDNQRIADPLNNILQNASAAVTASMQNIAVSRAIRDMLYLNLAASIPEDNREPHPNRLGVRIKGETKWFEVQDSMLVNALQATGDVNMPFLGLQATPARFLREMVTKDPSFMAANMLRDTLSSWVTSGVNVTPVVGTLKGYGDALMGTSSAKALIASGVVGGYDFKGDSKNVMKAFRKHMKLKSPVRHPFVSMWNALDSISGASDSSTRIAVYNRVLKETGDETRAIVEALEVINFSRKGANAGMRYLTAVVPFLNARVQGLDVLYRGAKGDIASVDKAKRRKRFYFRALMIVSLTAAYHMAQNAGDEEDNPWYHNAPEHVKDNFWIIPPTWFGGTRDSLAFRIPIPFEVGILFKVIPERIMQLIEGSTDGRELSEASLRHLTTTFNVSFPQWFQPAFEGMINHSFYSGRPVVSYWQGRNEGWMANPETASPVAIALSEALDEDLAVRVSAQKIDHVIRGYIGTLGSYALSMADSVARNAIDLPDRAAKSAHEEDVIRRFLQEPEGKGPLQTFYDLKTELDIFTQTMNSLTEGGDLNRADKYQLSRLNLEMHRPVIEALREEITALRLFRKQLFNDRSLTPEEKRDSVEGVDRQINELLHSHNIKKLRTEALTRQ